MTGKKYNNAALIAFDWGTTNVRSALLDSQGNLLDERRGESGVGVLSEQQFGTRFDAMTKDWPHLSALAAGMIGSRQGWKEAQYLSCPASPSDLAGGLVEFERNGQRIGIIPGLKLCADGRFDVMRGEETQLAGFISQNPHMSGTVVLPGTHSKWVKIEAGTIADFRTYMTGELFDVISEETILRHSVGLKGGPDSVFEKKLQELAGGQQSIEGQLFGLRARDLLEGSDDGHLRQELSALLISAELRAAQIDGFSVDGETILIGTDGLTEYYKLAFTAIGAHSRRVKGTSLVWPALFAIAEKVGMIGDEAA